MIYFNDSVVVAWVRGGFIEIAAHDPAQGAVFYRVLRARPGPPAMFRDNRCLQCHNSFATLGVPGFLAKSVPSALDGNALPWLGNYLTDHRSPITERWAGWFVTGKAGTRRHLGNAPVADRNIDDVQIEDANLNLADLRIAIRYERLSVAAQRCGRPAGVQSPAADDEPAHADRLAGAHAGARGSQRGGDRHRASATPRSRRWTTCCSWTRRRSSGVSGTSGFAESFSTRGPRDSKGRSLRDLDLKQRLFTHPCSYMIYSDAFEQLPPAAKRAIYARLWDVLSGAVRAPKYARLSAGRSRSDYRDPSRDEEGSARVVQPSPVPTLSAGSANGFCSRW